MKRLVLVLMLLMMPLTAFGQGAVISLADTTVDGTVTLIEGEDLNRYALNCTNTHATAHLRWGDSVTTTARGQRIPATLPIEILSTGPVYMISEDGATSITVSCTKELK